VGETKRLFLFGLPGVGKSYIGKLLEENYNFIFWDGDEALTEEMKQFIRDETPFTPEMTMLLSERIINTIEYLYKEQQYAQQPRPIVIAQAMLIDNDRQAILQKFPNMQFIHVVSDEEIAQKRIIQRNDWVTPSFASKIRVEFDKFKKSAEHYPVIVNNSTGDINLEEQIEAVINIKKTRLQQTDQTTPITNSAKKPTKSKRQLEHVFLANLFFTTKNNNFTHTNQNVQPHNDTQITDQLK
jgi:gluconate kinase